jgi:hypothetical protein
MQKSEKRVAYLIVNQLESGRGLKLVGPDSYQGADKGQQLLRVSQRIGYQGWYRGGKRVATGVVSQDLVEKTLFLINALKYLLNLRLRLRS